ncbi:MAG: TolC family protein [bacterium]|nr:TolC family protein [bacterium]
MKKNPDIQIEEMTVLSDKGEYQENKGGFDPTLTASATRVSAYSDYPLDGSDWSPLLVFENELSLTLAKEFRNGMTAEADISSTLVDAAKGTSLYNESAVTFTLCIPLLSGRGTASAGAVAQYYKILYEAQKLTLQHSVSDYVKQTAQAYWDYAAEVLTVEDLKKAEGRANQHLVEIKDLVNAKKAPDAEIDQAKAYHRTTTASRLAGEQTLLKAKYTLGILMGIPFRQTGQLPDPTADFPTIDLDRVNRAFSELQGFIDGAASARGDLLASDKNIEAAKVLVKKAKNETQNTLNLDVSVGYQGYNVDSKTVGSLLSAIWENTSGVTASVGLSYQLPIKNNTNIGTLVQYRASQKTFEIGKAQSLRSVSASIMVSLSNLKSILLELKELEESVEAYETAYKNEKDKYKEGKATQIDIITTENKLTAARVKVIAGKSKLAQEIVNFRFQTGTLTEFKGGKYSVTEKDLITLPAGSKN